MVTALTLYATNTNASTLTTARTLVTVTGAPSTTPITSLLGLATGYGQFDSQGTATAWAGAVGLGNPDGNGFLLDASTLFGQQLVGGSWTPAFRGKVSVGTASVTLYMRAYIYDSVALTYTPIGSPLSLTGVTLTTTSTTFTFSAASMPIASFATNQYLYLDVWANVLTNSTGSSAATIAIVENISTTVGQANSFNVVTAGYQPTPTPVLSATPATLSYGATVGGGNPPTQSCTLAETAGTATDWTSSIAYGHGLNWLTLSPATGTLNPFGTQVINFNCITGTRVAATYTATVTFTSTTGNATVTVAVTFVIRATTENSYGITNGLNPGPQYPVTTRLSQQVVNWAKADGHQNFRFQLDIAAMWRVQSDTTGGSGWDFAPLDDAIAKLTAAGMTITFPVRGMPDWSLVNTTYQATDEPWFMPNPADVLTACTVLASRYNGIFNIPVYGAMKIHKLEIGNEEYNIHFTKSTDNVNLAQAITAGASYATVSIQPAPLAVPSGVWMQFGTSGGTGDAVKLKQRIAQGDIVAQIVTRTGGTYTATQAAANGSALTVVYRGIRVGSNTIYDGHLGVLQNASPTPQPARDWWFLQQVLNTVGPVMRSNFPALRIGAGAIWWMWDENFTDFIVGLGSAIQWVEYVNFHFYSNGNDPHTGSGHSPSILTAITNVHNALITAGFPNTPIECTEFGWQVPTDCTAAQQATNYTNFLNDAKATGWLRRVYLFTYSDAQSAGTGASLYVWNATTSSFDERPALPIIRSFIAANPLLIAIPQISATPATLSFTATAGGGAPASQSSTLTETAGVATSWTSTIKYGTGAGWLTVSPLTGSIGAFGNQVQTYTCTPGTMVAGTYTATVTTTAATGGDTAVVTVTFIVTALEGIASAYKTQLVKAYNSAGVFLDVVRDAPLLTGFKEAVNTATSPLLVTLPRSFDNFDIGGGGGPGTVAQGNIWKYYLFGTGLPTTGKLRYQGVVDAFEPTIDASGAETVTVTLVPHSAALADHGIGGTQAFVNSDPVALFNWWFTNTDPITGVSYTSPLTLSPTNPTTSAVSVSYAFSNQTIASIFGTIIQMLPPNWFFRCNVDDTVTLNVTPAIAQHTFYLGQDCALLNYRQDWTNLKNVIYLTGGTPAGFGPETITPIDSAGTGNGLFNAVFHNSHTGTWNITVDPSYVIQAKGPAIASGTQTVTPSSMTNIVEGVLLLVSGGTGTAETVKVTAVTSSTFTATFASAHSGTYSIRLSPNFVVNTTASQQIAPGFDAFFPANTTNVLNGAKYLVGGGKNQKALTSSIVGSDIAQFGERMALLNDSRISDQHTLDVVAQGYLSLLDRVVIRTKVRIVDYRGDTQSGLGFDIETIACGDSCRIVNPVFPAATPPSSLWNQAVWDASSWDFAPGSAFGQIAVITALTYGFDYVDLEISTLQPNQDATIIKLRNAFQDFTLLAQ